MGGGRGGGGQSDADDHPSCVDGSTSFDSDSYLHIGESSRCERYSQILHC